jgi:hypothetical protein
MIHPSRTRHGPGRRTLALWLIAAQFILFTAGELAHRHDVSANAAAIASAPAGGHATRDHHARLQSPASSGHRAPAECPICRIAQSTSAATVTVQATSLVPLLYGHAPVYSPIFHPTLGLGPSSARAPPTL